MQVHTQQEFEASVKKGMDEAERMPGSGWLRLRCKRVESKNGPSLKFMVDGSRWLKEGTKDEKGERGKCPSASKKGNALDFEKNPWSQHAVQIEGQDVITLVTKCTPNTSTTAYLHFAKVEGVAGGGFPRRHVGLHTLVRSLGYVGSYLLQYRSASKLRCGSRCSSLLPIVAAPQAQGQHMGGTFDSVDSRASPIDISRVPLNVTQRSAVKQLGGGLDIVVGPPGAYLFVPQPPYGHVFSHIVVESSRVQQSRLG